MLRPLVLAACVAAAFAGCGDGDDDQPKRTVTVKQGQAVRVSGKEYSFDPEGVVVAGGGSVWLRLRNDGSVAHNLRIFEGERELGGTPTFQSGQARSATVSLRPGRYRMVCTVGDHERLGMTGSLRVRARN